MNQRPLIVRTNNQSLIFLDFILKHFIMIRLLLPILLILSSWSFSLAQDQVIRFKPKVEEDLSTVEAFAATITKEDMRRHLTIIASDEFEGRETGTPGNDLAAQYLANQFIGMGLPKVGDDNSYFQNVTFTWNSWRNLKMNINGQAYRHKKDFISFPTRNSDLPNLTTDEILFLGYGIDDERYSDYKGVDVTGKVLLIYNNEPLKKNGKSRITGSKELSEWSTDWSKKLRTAHQKGAKAVLIIDHEIKKMLTESLKFLIGSQITLGQMDDPKTNFANSAFISTDMAKEIMGDRYKKVIKARKKIQKRGKAKSIALPAKLILHQGKDERKLIGRNVLGYIEGSDPQLKKEIVVVSAHYDHLGKQGSVIYNGADDNGSGTTTVLEVAEAMAIAKRNGQGPKRSVLVLMMTGEEKGLLGSKYYAERPIFPLENTIADVNVDMVGRVDDRYKETPNYIYVIGSNRLSSELHEINEEMNEKYTNLKLDYTYNAEDDPNRYYYRSDHYNFAEKGIPAIFYFNGTHDDYHRPSDTVEKINFEKMEKIGRLVFYTAWELANRAERIKVD